MTIPKALASAATGECVGMIGGTSGSELIHGRFQRVHGGDQLCVCRGGAGAAAREMLRACLKMKNFIPPWGLLKNEQSDIFYIVQIFWEEEV